MKSTIFSLLPIAGLAVAESCAPRQTITTTQTETVYETARAHDLAGNTAVCSKNTMTTTVSEKVYVTVTPGAAPDAVEDMTSTNTPEMYSTVIVRPSGSTSAVHQPIAVSEVSSFSTLSVLPTTQMGYSSAYTPAPQSEAPKESEVAEPSETAAPTPEYVAPVPMMKAVAADVSTSAVKRGEATFYGGNLGGGMCSFTGYTIPSGIFGTALSDSNWSNSANCGACVSVTGPKGNKITAMVVDQCPGCGSNHLDLFENAFEKLAAKQAGVINVSWDIVPCGITSPLVLKNKEGTSPYWFSMQVMNSNVPVSKLEVSTDGGKSWKATTRKEYNYFENPSGFGTQSVDVKVTSSSGSSIVVKNVSIAASSKKTAGSNFK
jgi:expansin (peptidoglycan-binding protein)